MVAALLAAVLAAAAPASPEAVQLQQAQKDYFAGHLADAAREVDAIVAVDTKSVEIPPERPSLFVLLSAIRLKQNDAAGAKAAAQQALQVDPDVKVDDYPPPVQELVEGVRLQLPSRTLVHVQGIPTGAAARVDGRTVTAGALSVLPGGHLLVVEVAGAPAYRKTFAAAGSEMTLVVPPPPSAVAAETPRPTFARAPAATPTVLAARRTGGGGGLLSHRRLSTLCFAGSIAALGGAVYEQGYSIPTMRKNRKAAANPSYYTTYIGRANALTYVDAGLALGLAAAGAWQLHAARARIVALPEPGGGRIALTVRFGGPPGQ